MANARTTAKVIFLAVALILLSQCAAPVSHAGLENNAFPAEVTDAYKDARKSVLYSLNLAKPSEEPDASDRFHGNKILGQTTINDVQTAAVFNSLTDAVARANGISRCGESPLHGMRVVKDGHVFDLLICYQCGVIEVFKDNNEAALLYFNTLQPSGKPDLMNEMLEYAKIPLSPE